MTKRKDTIPVSSHKDDMNYNLESSAKKHKAMGGSDLIQRKFFKVDDND